MIGLSPGYLHSAFKLLEMVVSRELDLARLATSLPRIVVLPSVEVVNFVLGMGWVLCDVDGKAALSTAGARVYDISSASGRMRQSILDFVGSYNPVWSRLASKGRQEMLAVLSPEVSQCFAEADLIADYSEEVVRWWDALSARARGKRSEVLVEIGRQGERLSMRFEAERTGRVPVWQSIESNLAGYDILSIVGPTDDRKLQIEVKATEESIEYGAFHITRNEWETSLLADDYIFHLWLLNENNPALAVVSTDEIRAHIPTDGGQGEWQAVMIPYPAFRSHFRPVGKGK